MKCKFVCLLAGLAVGITAMPEISQAKTVTGLASYSGLASYYKSGKRTANGERYNPHGLTAAHRNLPFGTKVKVTIIKTGKSVVVRINDRGPFNKNRVIDLSLGAANLVGLTRSGIAKVYILVIPEIGPAAVLSRAVRQGHPISPPTIGLQSAPVVERVPFLRTAPTTPAGAILSFANKNPGL